MTKKIPKEIKEEIISKAKAGQKVKDLASQYGKKTLLYYPLHQQTSLY